MSDSGTLSIQKRLHKRVLLVSIALVGVFLLFAYVTVQHETDELFDAQLARSARLILSLAQAEIKEGMHGIARFQQFLESNRLQAAGDEHIEGEEARVDGHYYETKLAFVVARSPEDVFLHSYNAPVELAQVDQPGYATRRYGDDDWRVFRLDSGDGSLYCVTAERLDVRNDLIYTLSSDLIALFVALLLTLAVVIWFAIGSGLAPLRLLAEQIRRRDVDNLSEVSVENVPQEVRAIIQSLNRLFKRLSAALTRERHITSDAAHELRTPLAAVKLHAELALSATGHEDREQSLQYVIDGTDRCTHLVDQLLKLARLEPQAVARQRRAVELTALVSDMLHQHREQAAARHIALRERLPATCTVRGDEDALRLMLRNLLDNAISYTQRGGRVEVSIQLQQDRVCLVVADNGPGIAADKRERIFERFYRVENHEKTGCGIGMAIVARVCELHQASIELSDPETGSGLVVTVCLPAE